MIKLERVRTAEAIPEGLRGKARVQKQITLVRAKLSGQLDDTHYWASKGNAWKRAKEQLRQETHGKCAYCEAPTDLVAHGDVEHFRPKSKYWWLAYCYDNYLYACQICNETHKSDYFEVSGKPLPKPNLCARLGDCSDQQLEEVARCMTPDPLDDREGKPLREFLREEHWEFLKRLPLYYETDGHFFAHANYAPNQPWSQQSSQVLLWLDLADLPGRHYSGKTAIVGHTPQKDGKVLDLGYLKCIDTGCGHGGLLTALDVDSGRIWQVTEDGREV